MSRKHWWGRQCFRVRALEGSPARDRWKVTVSARLVDAPFYVSAGLCMQLFLYQLTKIFNAMKVYLVPKTPFPGKVKFITSHCCWPQRASGPSVSSLEQTASVLAWTPSEAAAHLHLGQPVPWRSTLRTHAEEPHEGLHRCGNPCQHSSQHPSNR